MIEKSGLISVSVLNMDFTCLGESVRAVEAAGADSLHMDIMDGHFVNNISFGPDVVAAVRGITKLPIHTHLMIENPEKYAGKFFSAGSDTVTVHVETLTSEAALSLFDDAGRIGLSLNPDAPLSLLEPYLDKAVVVLIMSVFAGFGGQKFIPQAVERITALSEKRLAAGLDFLISVDGGINPSTAAGCLRAGADEVVVGSYVSRSGNPAASMEALRAAISRSG